MRGAIPPLTTTSSWHGQLYLFNVNKLERVPFEEPELLMGETVTNDSLI